MQDGENTTNEVEPDVDAIRHVNQFGTPEVPVMEIACVPEKVDLSQTSYRPAISKYGKT